MSLVLNTLQDLSDAITKIGGAGSKINAGMLENLKSSAFARAFGDVAKRFKVANAKDTKDAVNLGQFELTESANDINQKFPNGFEIKLGSRVSTIDGDESFFFDVPFENNCFSVEASRTDIGVTAILPVIEKTKEKFTINRNDNIDGQQNFNFVAYGN